jgi:hypothetical protein
MVMFSQGNRNSLNSDRPVKAVWFSQPGRESHLKYQPPNLGSGKTRLPQSHN